MKKIYNNPFPAGVKLPSIEIEKRHLDALGLEEGVSNFEFLRRLCFDGVKKKGIGFKPNSEEYYSRLKMELSVLDELGFTDYILLNWDVINFCHENGIPTGKGRGSAAGSLVLYTIGVTDIDPIKYDLFFERFVSKSRARKIEFNGEVFLDGSLLCDVDNDISYDRRGEVIDYIKRKHEGRTSKILTMNTLSSKLCIKECGKLVAGMSEAEVNAISDKIPKKFGKVSKLGDAFTEDEEFKKFALDNKKLFKISKKLEGLVKNVGVHPSGIAISRYELSDIMPTTRQADDDNSIVSGVDMNDVASVSVKFDILGLRTLSVVHDVCMQLGLPLNDIDIHDKSIYMALQNLTAPCGLFQIEADTNFKVAQKVKPRNLEELSAVVAIARPGALDFLDSYATYVRTGESQSVHPFFDDILSYTGGIPLYQEQLMKMAVKIGFDLDSAETLRRIVGKKKVSEMGAWKEKIESKIKENNLDPKIGEVLWKVAEDSANYSFNKCAYEEELVNVKGKGDVMLKDVNIGDYVRAYDYVAKQDHYVKVLDVMYNETDVFEFEMENGLSVRCSMKHKFLDAKDFYMRPISHFSSTSGSEICIGRNKSTSIERVYSLGTQRTVDLEVDHPHHNFYLQGLVTSNSHSISYAALAATTVFLKANYTKEFYLSLLKFTKFEPAPHEEIAKIAQELHQYDIKLLPPDLSKSQLDFSIEGNNIRYGLNSIKGVSTKSLEAIIEFREAEFANKYEVFLAAKQAGINIGLLSALIQAGVLDSFCSKDRCRLVLEAQTFNLLTDREKRNFIAIGEKYNYDILDSIKACVDENLIGDDNKKIFSEKRFGTFKPKYSQYREIYAQNRKFLSFANWFFETKLLGYSYSQNIRDIFKAESANAFTISSDIADRENGATVWFIGTLTECMNRTSRNGNKYARFSLSDENGTINALMVDSREDSAYSAFLREYESMPKEGQILMVKGKKSDDVIMIDSAKMLGDKIYMKLSELK